MQWVLYWQNIDNRKEDTAFLFNQHYVCWWHVADIQRINSSQSLDPCIKWFTNGLDNGLLPIQHQDLIWTDDGSFLIRNHKSSRNDHKIYVHYLKKNTDEFARCGVAVPLVLEVLMSTELF